MEGNKLKLGVFAFNLDGGFTATTVPERFRLTWDNVTPSNSYRK